MDNKQKPSSLYVVPTHHDLDVVGTNFTDEMLTWPIMSRGAHPEPSTDEASNTVLRTALKALMGMKPFGCTVSLEVNEEQKYIAYPRRMWGEINLGETTLKFSHHSKKDNQPFSTLAEWVEFEEKPHNSEKEWTNNWEETYKTLATWPVDEWTQFFRKKIFEKAIALKKKAKKKREDADALAYRGDDILVRLTNCHSDEYLSL